MEVRTIRTGLPENGTFFQIEYNAKFGSCSWSICYCSSRRYVTLLMKKTRPFISEKFYSSTYSLDYLAKDLRIGEYWDFYVMESERNTNPEGLAAIYGQTLYGREALVFEVRKDLSFS